MQPFTPQLATEYIKAHPGKTSEEIVRDLCDRGIIECNSDIPGGGQRGALSKMYTGGRLPEVRRDETRRPYRYFPRNGHANQPQPVGSASTQSINLKLTETQEKVLEGLVAMETVANRTEGIHLLIDHGIQRIRQGVQLK